MVGGMALALIAYIPGYHAIADAVNPALVAAQELPVVVETDPATCSVQFDPAGTRRFDTACDIAKASSLRPASAIPTAPRPTARRASWSAKPYSKLRMEGRSTARC